MYHFNAHFSGQRAPEHRRRLHRGYGKFAPVLSKVPGQKQHFALVVFRCAVGSVVPSQCAWYGLYVWYRHAYSS